MLFDGYDIPISGDEVKLILLFNLFWVYSRHIMIYSITKESVNADEFGNE